MAYFKEIVFCGYLREEFVCSNCLFTLFLILMLPFVLYFGMCLFVDYIMSEKLCFPSFVRKEKNGCCRGCSDCCFLIWSFFSYLVAPVFFSLIILCLAIFLASGAIFGVFYVLFIVL